MTKTRKCRLTGTLQTCFKCKKDFDKRWQLKLHLQRHPGLAPAVYICPLCTAKFGFASIFKNHLFLVHNVPKMDRPFKCQVDSCGRRFGRITCLKAHKIYQHGTLSPYICKKCDEACLTRGHLKKHSKRHKKKQKSGDFKCVTCGKVLKTSRGLKWHEFFHSCPKVTTCKYCDKSFSSGAIGEMHMYTQHGNGAKRFMCQVCGKHYTNKKTMLKHSKECANHLTCAMCGKSDFPNRRSLVTHEQSHVRVACGVCGKLYGLGPQLQWHSRYCKPDSKKVMCSRCGAMVCKLADHIRSVHTPKPKGDGFPCDICGQILTQKCHLYQHMKIHNERRERSFVCEVCGKGFYYKRNLTDHQAVHEKKKSQCPYCPKVLYSHAGLQCHMRLHTGEKRYKCARCAKGFTTSSGLKYHEKSGKCQPSDMKDNSDSPETVRLTQFISGIH